MSGRPNASWLSMIFGRPDISLDRFPTAKEFARHFKKTGSSVHYCGYPDFLFYVDKKHTRFAFGINRSDLSQINLALLAECGYKSSCYAAIVTEVIPPEALFEEGIERKILFLHYKELHSLESRLLDLPRLYRERVADARNAVQQGIDGDAETTAILQISHDEKEAGLFYKSIYMDGFFADRGGQVLLVTFNESGLRADGRTYYGAELGEKIGCSVAGLMSRNPNWFPAHDVEQCVQSLQQVINARFSDVICLGFEQGGYAAIKYSKMFGASIVIAFSPHYSIDPADVDDGRYNRYFKPELHARMKIKNSEASGKVYIFFDPESYQCDRRHTDLISATVAANLLQLPFSGSASGHLFSKWEQMDRILQATMASDLGVLRRCCAEARHRNTERAFHMAFSLADRRPETACRIFEKYQDLTVAGKWSSVCYRLAVSGKASRVVSWLESAVEVEPDNVDLRVCLSLVFLELKEPVKALAALSLPLARDRDNKTYLWIEQRAHEMRLALVGATQV